MQFHNFTLFIAYFVTFFDSECIACKSRSDTEIKLKGARYVNFIHTEVYIIQYKIQDYQNMYLLFLFCHNYLVKI